jgi:hypothetical protein
MSGGGGRQRGAATRVYLEVGRKKTFAMALDGPGWGRSGKTGADALDALARYAPRYAVVASRAGLDFAAVDAAPLVVVEEVSGDATTDFGAPGAFATSDTEEVTESEARRLAALVRAAWDVLAEAVDAAPAELRKGPRGGGRDRDPMVAHVLDAEAAYARKIGVRHKPPALGDAAAIEALRTDILAAIEAGAVGSTWPIRYAARRIAWHALDHAWEMADRVPATAPRS